jgi:Fic family protein
MSSDDRHSEALEVDLILDPDQRALREAENVLRQFNTAIEQIEYWLQPDRPFNLRASAILTLNRIALEGINRYAGSYRPGHVEISGSKHKPPPAHLVPELLEGLCDYVNENWSRSPIHLASYVMWRLNWIHPFVDGNGRTTRVISFVVLCVRLGYRLPGSNTVPEQISKHKKPYYDALEAADTTYEAKGKIDVSAMETLVGELLTNQLAAVIHKAREDQPPRA